VIKPSRLMLGWLGALLASNLLLGSADALGIALPPALHAIAWGMLLALVLLGMLDAWRVYRLPSPHVRRHVPGSLPLGRWSEVRLDISHRYPRPLNLQLFDHVPDGLGFDDLPQSIELQPGQDSQLGYRLRPLRRGLFQWQRLEWLVPSPMGLWRQRRFSELEDSARVYPDFARLYGARLLAVDSWLSQMGVRQRPRRGQGLEFNQLREFREGDSLRQIDWKATARQRMPITREYQEERDQQIIFLLDCGRSMRSQDGDLAHLDHALNACLLLSYVALRQGDAVGLATFASNQARYLPPVKGPAQLNVLLNAVYDLESSQRPADYAAAAEHLLARQNRRALVVLVTNLRDEDDDQLLGAIKRISRRHRVLIASLREEVLDELRQSPVQTWQQALSYCGTIDYLNARAQLHERLSAHGVPVLDARPGELGAQLVTRYLSWKKAGTL